MAQRAQPIGPLASAGIGLAVAIPALLLACAAAVAVGADGKAGLSPADWSAIRFTLAQAMVSASISVALAVPLARALARRDFPFRGAMITLLGAPFLLPVIVAIFGLLAIFGRNGAVNGLLDALGLPPVGIYGFHGVVIAHVFFNLPLATRLFLQGWQEIPAERLRLAASLGMGPGAILRHLEIPMLARHAPGAFLVIFVICTTSFAVALTLGGGPRATTIELAIYQALRFEFDLPRAALLSLVQLAVTGAAAAVMLRLAGQPGFGAGRDRPVHRWDSKGAALRLQDAALVTLGALFLLAPLLAVVAAGLPRLGALPEPVWLAAWRSVWVALLSTALVVSAALSMAVAATALRNRGWWVEAAGLLGIAASPLVVGTGLFLILFPFVNPADLALPITALVNALLTLPFALRAVLPAVQAIETAHGRLADSLGLRGWARLRLLVLPRLARPLGFAAGIAAALSMGDLGVIALFADPETATLPLQIYRLMGAFRMQDAAAASLLLLLLSFALFALFDLGARRHADP